MSSYFTKKTWLDRVAGNKNKRSLTDIDTSESANYTVERAEGKVYEQELVFNAANMNNIENRVETAFNSLETALNPVTLFELLYPVGIIYLSYNDVNPGSAVASGGLGRGTWTRLTGGLLVPSASLPADMRNNLQWEGVNSREVTPQGTVGFGTSDGYTAYASAGIPYHSHSLTEYRTQEVGEVEGGYKYKNTDNSYLKFGKIKTLFSTTGSAGTSSSGHRHKFSGSGRFTGNKITINTTQRSLTISAWVRTA